MPMGYSLLLGAALFCVGMVGVVMRRRLLNLAVSLSISMLGVTYTAALLGVWRSGRHCIWLGWVVGLTGASVVGVLLVAGLAAHSTCRGADAAVGPQPAQDQ